MYCAPWQNPKGGLIKQCDCTLHTKTCMRMQMCACPQRIHTELDAYIHAHARAQCNGHASSTLACTSTHSLFQSHSITRMQSLYTHACAINMSKLSCTRQEYAHSRRNPTTLSSKNTDTYHYTKREKERDKVKRGMRTQVHTSTCSSQHTTYIEYNAIPTQVPTPVCMYSLTEACGYKCARTHTYIHTYTHTHTHTYIHTHIQRAVLTTGIHS
jgi:hypothetical protein